MQIDLILNGIPTTLQAAPNQRAIDVLREDMHLTGTKEACGAGECGACTILVDGTPRLACMMLAVQLDGRTITTIEGVARNGTLHPVQQMFIEYGAVQCGFCTPGMVLSAIALLEQNPHPTRDEICEGLSGNLCRCTGYAKIIDAVQAAARVMETSAKPLVPLKKNPGNTLDTKATHNAQCYLPNSLDELWKILDAEPNAILYAGGTDVFVKMRGNETTPRVFVCLERIEELKGIREQTGIIRIGAGTTHSELVESPLVQEHLPILVRAVRELGSPLIRNMGTIGGNICTASPGGDTLPPLYVLDAQVELRTSESTRRMPLSDFIVGSGKTQLGTHEILTAVWVSKPAQFNIQHFEKVGRRNALACSLVSFAALLRVSDAGIVKQAALAWGSVAPTVLRSHDIEQMLIGGKLTAEKLKQVGARVRALVSPIDDVRATAEYRRKIAGNLVLRLLDTEKKQ